VGSEAPSLVGTVLDGRYRIDAPIARGGMSTVFQGVDIRLDRPIAIKLMDPQFAGDPQFLHRFELEARSVARLSHPALVSVYDQGVDGHHVFIVMELVPGGTLRELLRERGPMPPHATAAAALPVLNALAVAHQAGLVHRDIKPENVLISDTGSVKIADFGLVRAVASSTTTSSSVILGTAAYLSPEQVTTGAADARSDVYSMGILLFEMLTGKVPFTGDTSISIAYQRVNSDVMPPSQFIAGVPAEFDQLVLHATQRDPKRRFRDAGAMAAALMSISRQLNLPPYTVPAPKGSAQHRSARAMTNAAMGALNKVLRPKEPAPPQNPPQQAPQHPGQAGRPHPGAAPAQHTRALTQAIGPSGPGVPPPVAPGRLAPRQARPPGLGRREPNGLPSGSRGRRPRPLVWALLIGLLTLLLGFAGWWFGAGRTVVVPDVLGMSPAAAEEAIRDIGLDPVVEPVYSNTEPADRLLEVSPAAGSSVQRGSDVALRVSFGRPAVPEIEGRMSVGDMEELLRERTFIPVVGEPAFSRDVPEGLVAFLEPGPGSVLDVGSTVTIIPSRGEPAIVPDVRDMTEAEARAAIADAGLTVSGTEQRFDQSVADGRVADATPGIGAEVGPGSGVTLVISTAVEVPSVVGRTVDDARRTLTNLGFNVEVRQFLNRGDSRVLSQSPSGGARSEPGATVVLTALP
jgi:serine/threonine protein kinase/beta-lactam-binding protein with PASTA domain